MTYLPPTDVSLWRLPMSRDPQEHSVFHLTQTKVLSAIDPMQATVSEKQRVRPSKLNHEACGSQIIYKAGYLDNTACCFLFSSKLPGFMSWVGHNEEYQRFWINTSYLIIDTYLKNCLSNNLRNNSDPLKSTRQAVTASVSSTDNNCLLSNRGLAPFSPLECTNNWYKQEKYTLRILKQGLFFLVSGSWMKN